MQSSGELKRSLTLFDVVALGINGVIGSGIFLLPGIVAEAMGPAAMLVTVFAGILCFLIALCFAETGSYFSETGGPYLYAHAAFGGFLGFEVGWMTWWVRIISWAALSNAFCIALAHFFRPVGEGWVKTVVILLLIGGLAAVNVRGAKSGARVTNLFTIAKLVPLVLFVGVGLFFIEPARFEPFAPSGYSAFGRTVITILWAFVGFEVLAVPAGEMQNPRRAVVP